MTKKSIILAFLLFSATAHAEQSNDPVKMGLILPLTGTAQSWGKHMVNAAELALSHLNPETRSRLQLIFEDDQLNAGKAVSAFNKLSSVDHIDVGVVFGGQSVASVSPLAEKLKIPIFVVTANSHLVEGKKYSFRHWLDAARQVSLLVPFIHKKKISGIAVVVVSHEAMLEYVNQFEDAASPLGIKTVFKEEFAPAEIDFKTSVAKIRLAKADAVIISLLPPQMSAFMKEFDKNQLSMPVFGFSNVETASEVEAAQGSMEGIIYTAPQLDSDFIRQYQEKYKEYPELSAPNVYDMIKIVAQAIESGAHPSQEIAQYIASLEDFHGALGTYRVTPQHDFTLRPQLKTIKNGEFIPLSAAERKRVK